MDTSINDIVNSELFETIATNIADVITNFSDYKMHDDETLEEHLEQFGVVWLDGSDEYVVAFDCEVLFDGFSNEEDAEHVYDKLNDRAWEISQAQESKAN